ncbi:hypothetical protein LRS03_02055 [Rhizobacter sp. J219]|uniref:hypothetical protein n=1 Tax=Rhizobacter sp. J219 TaxID=2898430 RepID=UPI0021519749|nr:hypothetical protein [Rhizobacter sp. J219]MCR5881706.1 hypothetical protein [Rhizobacter sp. J219]
MAATVALSTVDKLRWPVSTPAESTMNTYKTPLPKMDMSVARAETVTEAEVPATMLARAVDGLKVTA